SEHLIASHLEVQGQIRHMNQEKPSTREELFRRVSNARNYVDEHFLEDLNLDDLASLANLSKYHFLRCFKQVYGHSPYQYVIARRLQHGRELVRQNQHSLTEIAYLTGFSDRRAFNKAFKKAYGLGPTDYRKSC
ncbi:MAG: AraC family transcriptional regulator, partial [Bacteroidota bacterium]